MRLLTFVLEWSLHNRAVVIVATANKLARIAWAVLASGNNYHPLHKPAFSN